MSLISRLFGSNKPVEDPPDPYWQRNSDLKYPRLLQLYGHHRKLQDKGGVFITWSTGVRSGWVIAGTSDNLAETVEILMDAEALASVSNRGSLFFTWSPIKPELQNGVVRYLRDAMPFLVDSEEADAALKMDRQAIQHAKPIPVLPPG